MASKDAPLPYFDPLNSVFFFLTTANVKATITSRTSENGFLVAKAPITGAAAALIPKQFRLKVGNGTPMDLHNGFFQTPSPCCSPSPPSLIIYASCT